MTSSDEMNLPEGKSCADCVHCYRCTKIFGAKPENKQCDFHPIRFYLKPAEPPQAQGSALTGDDE